MCRAYIQQLWDSKFFNFKEGQPQTPPLGNWTATGHLKRADMAVGRQRPDLMHSLPQDLVREMAQLKPLFSDKKVRIMTVAELAVNPEISASLASAFF